ncbi:MAG: HAD family phosphatase [Planctomycetota bacterium]
MQLPSQPLRAVTLDLDGTLASSEDVYFNVGHATLNRRGKTFDDDLRNAMMGRPATAALQVMIDWHGLNDSVETLAAESEQLFWRFAQDDLKRMPGVDQLFDLLDERELPRGIATSGGRRYAERILELLGLAGRVAFAITADDVRQGKPHPEPYLQAAAKHGVDAAEMLVIEDSAVGSQAGVAAGAYTIATPNAHTAGHDFTGVAFVAHTLADPRIAQALAFRGA